MLEILVIAIVLVTLAAKKGRRRRGRSMGKYMRGSIDEEFSLGTLAAKTLASTLFDEVVTETTLVSSIVATWALANVTPIANQGPVLVGVAHSDYTDPEIEEFIEATGSWSPADMIQQEISKRKIRRIGIFILFVEATPLTINTLNNGRPIKTKLNWTLNTGQTLRLWAYNLGSAAFATTTPNVDAQGHANLWRQ